MKEIWKDIKNYDEKLQVNYIDGNKSNNNVNNLEMVTSSENKLHAYRVLKRKTNGKVILQYDLDNNFIKKYASACEANRQTKICRSCINDCCNVKLKTTGGYKWKY